MVFNFTDIMYDAKISVHTFLVFALGMHQVEMQLLGAAVAG